jgi:hypothetical protein
MWFNTRKQVVMIIFRRLLVAGAVIIIAAAFCFIASRAIIKISDSLQQKQELAQLLALRISNIQRLKDSLAILGDGDEKISSIYLPTDNILDFVGALESLATQNSLKQTLSFGNFAPITSINGLTVEKTDYTINLNGNVTSLKKYLEQLENISFVSKIGAVNLLASPPFGWNGDSTITINGSLYAKQTQ